MSSDLEYRSYWDTRSKTYDRLDDVKSKRTAYKIINVVRSLSPDRNIGILDIGCGSGNITREIRDNFRHSCVSGIDISKEMIKIANFKKRDNLFFYWMDLFKLDKSLDFDFITMNLVLHHLINGKDKEALSFLFENMVSDNGWVIISEAVPPVDDYGVYEHYSHIFKLKEERNCYTITDLVSMLRGSGFSSVRSYTYRFNIKLLSWLHDDTISSTTKGLIYDLHMNASDKFKKAYRMKDIGMGDYLLSCKMAIVWGRRSG